MARIAVGGFQHESNSFVSHRADFAYFAAHRDRPPLVRGADVIAALSGGGFALSGFLADIGGRQHEIVPLVWTSGGAGGNVTADAFERVVGELAGRLSLALPVDALYLDLHGAMVAEGVADADGEILRRIRAIVGDAVPIVVSFDYHANVSPETVQRADGIVGFLTYPHVDRRETGARAARLVEALLERGRPAGRALRKLPFLVPIEFQSTLSEPCRSLVAQSCERAGDLVDLCWFAGFPAADTAWCGPAVVAHAWTQAEADRAADALLARALACEPLFAGRLWPVESGVREAIRLARAASKPVVVSDTQDNPGAGGSGRSTGIIRELIRLQAQQAVAGLLCDPDAAAAAHRAGVGSTIRLALGGDDAPDADPPITAEWTIAALGSGRFQTSGSVCGVGSADLGPMARLRRDGVDVVVTSRRMQAYDPAPFHHVGVDLTACRILVLKSSCHFRADFEPLAETVMTILAPGGYQADPGRYPYRRLRAGVRPLK